ncbi:AGAP002891-PE-like protein [Anopheles sinensis]|uniref:AGAP002891-PE-like protein n=1 Tax=Anopheles sinensis TaxID=74873 RepID=A0A084VT39_ANOSI|nr:AGAP002891-PE-like protein [Anopheles sinensis]
MWRKKGTTRTGKGRSSNLSSEGGLERLRANSTDYTERIFHDEEFGEENVELVDEEWASFERVLRLGLDFSGYWVVKLSKYDDELMRFLFRPVTTREFRQRRLLNSSMDNLPRQKKSSRRRRAQAFYPMPMPSMSDTVDDQDSSSVSSSDEAYETDEDGYIRTLLVL